MAHRVIVWVKMGYSVTASLIRSGFRPVAVGCETGILRGWLLHAHASVFSERFAVITTLATASSIRFHKNESLKNYGHFRQHLVHDWSRQSIHLARVAGD